MSNQDTLKNFSEKSAVKFFDMLKFTSW